MFNVQRVMFQSSMIFIFKVKKTIIVVLIKFKCQDVLLMKRKRNLFDMTLIKFIIHVGKPHFFTKGNFVDMKIKNT